MKNILGSDVKDSISDIEGFAFSITTFISGCQHVGIRRKGTGPLGNPYELIYVELQSIEGYEKFKKHITSPILGKKVKDKITGYEGIAVDVTDFIHSDSRVGIQSSNIFEGRPALAHVTDLSNIESLEEVNTVIKKKTGGPLPTATLSLKDYPR